MSKRSKPKAFSKRFLIDTALRIQEEDGREEMVYSLGSLLGLQILLSMEDFIKEDQWEIPALVGTAEEFKKSFSDTIKALGLSSEEQKKIAHGFFEFMKQAFDLTKEEIAEIFYQAKNDNSEFSKNLDKFLSFKKPEAKN